MMFPRFLTLVAMLFCLASIASGDATLPTEEVEALKQIAKTLGKKNWNFSVDPCSGKWNWSTPNPEKGFENAVWCDCSFAKNTTCHVTSIVLKAQSLPGTLPRDLSRLPYLQELDLTRNYLNGTIPPEWGSTKLVNVSLLGNRISGHIPPELGNITTLANLTLSSNRLSGRIPPRLGYLPRIEKLEFTSNNLSGDLPSTLSRLTTLKDFRIGDNQFSGSIPIFIQSWTNLERLAIQGSGLDGPIPSEIASLTKLTDLRISDLKGNYSNFPRLSKAKNLISLILRSCNIDGPFPTDLQPLTKLKVLDLSFNRIRGEVPTSPIGASDIGFIYLTENLLTGTVPRWMLDSGADIDLSYNNFTLGRSRASTSEKSNLNLFNLDGNLIDTVSSMKSCPRYFSLHINCGGEEHDVGNKHFEGDTDAWGSAKFFRSSTNWAVSSTGHFIDDKKKDSYILTNRSRISGDNSELYMNARLSPLSLTYQGFCLLNGNYTVNLYFAEIKFTDDRTYSSLGRRIFDIYIQGKLVQIDFNIEDAAQGVNKPINISFPAEVVDNRLNIRFYWAGKGTIDIPTRGVYGPLISAISVDPDFTPPEHRNALSVGAIVGIVIGLLFTLSVLTVFLWQRGCLRDTLGKDFRGFDLQTASFTLKQIKAATNDFDVANKIGEGGFGSVYKGNLPNGRIVAVKQLSSKSKQGNREFVNEIGMISALQHPNLVKLYGCCVERNQLLLVYEYMENNSLARALFGPKEHQLKLDWPTRRNICVGIARGLAYLHEESRLRIVHRDIKATNVLLDKNLNPKISDFGLAKLHEEENSHISTRIAGTFGYMAPEYAMRGYLTDKADVYSFGVVLLEILSGKSNTSIKPVEECFYVLDWARLLKEEGKLMELVDSRLGSDFDSEEVMLTINVALLCTDVSPNVRPSMSMVVSTLEGQGDQELIGDPSTLSSDKMKSWEMADVQLVPDSTESQTISMSDMPGTAFSASSDMYPIILNTDFRETQNTDISALLR